MRWALLGMPVIAVGLVSIMGGCAKIDAGEMADGGAGIIASTDGGLDAGGEGEGGLDAGEDGGEVLDGGEAGACSAAACDAGLACISGVCRSYDPTCSYRPDGGTFTPRTAWTWSGSTAQPDYADVLTTPVVIALSQEEADETSIPAVVFNAIVSGQGAGAEVPGILRAVSGADGTDLWASDPAHLVNGLAGIAAGDLLGTGETVFVTARLPTTWPSSDPDHTGPPSDDGLLAFSNDGGLLWDVTFSLGGDRSQRVYWGAPSIANLYGGDEAQVVIGATVIDAHGNVVCQGAYGQGDNWLGPISTVADVDLDGSPDIVTGNTVYDNECSPKSGWPNGEADGLVAVANFTGDDHPEIAVVSGGTVRLQDWQGNVIWGPEAIPGITDGKGGGAPTIADFDGDGQLEIGVAGASTYTVFKPFATDPVLWSTATQDASRVTGSSVFDFQDDGKAEVVYGDECYTRVYDGTSGVTLFQSANPSCTVHENPVIADVDGDGRAEIVVATNSVCKITCPWGDHEGSGLHGITVFKDLRDQWVSTRPVWNQHAYHVTNVNDDGTIPTVEAKNWVTSWYGEVLNDFRMNPIGSGDFLAPDLSAEASDVTVDITSCPTRLVLEVNVWNRGAVRVAAGVPIAVYLGSAGGTLLATAQTTGAIAPGSSELVTLAFDMSSTMPSPMVLVVVLNDDGTGQGVVSECRTSDDAIVLSGLVCEAPAE